MPKKSEEARSAQPPPNQQIPQMKLVPSKELVDVIHSFQPKKFYKLPMFYFSLFALFTSIAALYIAFSSSPISPYMRPNIEYHYSTNILSEAGDALYDSSMTAIIVNKSNKSAEDLFVYVVTGSVEPAHIVIQEGIQYTLEKNSDMVALIKFPLFPANSFCIIVVQVEFENPQFRDLPHGIAFPQVSSVYSRDVAGKFVEELDR
jgi:hypothetical protein